MATKKQARITLVGPLSYSVGRYRFAKNRPVVTEDMELVKYLGADPNFRVELLDVEVEAKAKPSAPPAAQKPAAPAADEAEEETVEKPGLLKKAANAVKSMGKPGSPSKLTQKESKKETAHETD